MFFIDKYRPNEKKLSSFHNETLDLLEIMSKDNEIPHIIMYGPDGSGKKTLINIYLKMLFGKNVENAKDISYEIVSSGGKKKVKKIRQSNYHIEIDPTGTNYDRYLVHDIVGKYAESKSLNTLFENNKQFKLVLINNMDNLSQGAQEALRRTMEWYNDKCRFIMWCKTLSKVIDPIRSRCIQLRIPAPSNKDIFKYIFDISVKENINLNLEDYSNIINNANGNIKTALWNLQFLKHGYMMNTEYFNSINKINNLLLKLDYEKIFDIRNLFIDLMITNYTCPVIIKDLVDKMLQNTKLTKDVKNKILMKASEIDYRLLKGRREIIHVDAFIMSVMKYMKK